MDHDEPQSTRKYRGMIALKWAFALFLPLGITLYVVEDFRCNGWLKFHIHYREYLRWKEQGGPFKNEFSPPLTADRNVDSMISGLSYDQIRMKFPTLVDGDQYPADSYKGNELAARRKKYPETKMLWFSERDGFDHAIIINSEMKTILLIKG